MTSGNLLTINAFKKVDPFEEKLFIDYIDIEYCLHSKQNSYHIVQVNSSILNHKLGNPKVYSLGRKRFLSTNHEPWRRYYITRNRIYVWRHYWKIFPDFIKDDFYYMIKELIKIILVENQ